MDNSNLYHHGIKGMRWGIRRFQNRDGSLTPQGKRRRRENDAEEAKKNESTKTAESTSSKPKSVKDMTDAELTAGIARLKLEKEYRDRYNELNPQTVEKGKSFAKTMLDDAVKPAFVDAGKEFLKDALIKVGKEALKDQVDPNSLDALETKYKKLEWKKKINDIQKNEESVDEAIKRLENEQKLRNLKDDEYQNLKRDADKAKWRDTILTKGKNKNDDDDEDDEEKKKNQ